MILDQRADFGWPGCKAATANPKKGLVAHYNGPATGLLTKEHTACVKYWKNTRDFHVNTKGWADIGYSFGVCPHGHVMQGRGLGFAQAAQGTSAGNRDWYSCTFMLGTGEKPTALQIAAWHDLRDWLHNKGLALAVKGHFDFFNTDCPGTMIKRLITDGTLTGNKKDDAVATFKDVWQTDALTAPPWEIEKGNPTWMASSYLTNMYVKVSQGLDLLKDMDKRLKAIEASMPSKADAT